MRKCFRNGWRVAVPAGACVLAVLATGPAPRPVARAQEATTPARRPIGPTHHGHAFEYANYEPSFLDQEAGVAVRCLGVTPHPRRSNASLARFRVELHNTTDEDLELVKDSLHADWARRRRTPERGVRPEKVESSTEVEPGESSHVRVAFALREGDPDDVYVLRLRWSLRSDAGTVVLQRTVFARERPGPGGRFLYTPAYDPFGDVSVRGRWP
ncbi:MAG: hypothetical protein ACOC9O_04380 [Myxococcota bacterium]